MLMNARTVRSTVVTPMRLPIRLTVFELAVRRRDRQTRHSLDAARSVPMRGDAALVWTYMSLGHDTGSRRVVQTYLGPLDVLRLRDCCSRGLR
jgi:hypothetical protein